MSPKRGVFFHKVKALFFGHATEHVAQFPDQGPNPHPLPQKHRVLTTEWPRSAKHVLKAQIFMDEEIRRRGYRTKHGSWKANLRKSRPQWVEEKVENQLGLHQSLPKVCAMGVSGNLEWCVCIQKTEDQIKRISSEHLLFSTEESRVPLAEDWALVPGADCLTSRGWQADQTQIGD